MNRGLSRREFLTRAAAGAVAVGARQGQPVKAGQSTFRSGTAGESRDLAGLTMQWCPSGRFVMGSPANEVGRRPDEAQATVTLSRGFWMARHEVTQDQWLRVMSAFPDKLPSAVWGEGPSMPVYWISFLEAEGFCRRVTERAHAAGTLPKSWEFRIPSEAQWEYACRAGTTTATAFGDALDIRAANFLGDSERAPDAAALKRAGPVGSYRANAWGLFDMHGNIFEWCRDWYHDRLPGGTDPDLYEVRGVPNRDGSYSRVRRGGAWNDPQWACRSALRLRYEPERRSDHIGFRVAVVEVS